MFPVWELHHPNIKQYLVMAKSPAILAALLLVPDRGAHLQNHVGKDIGDHFDVVEISLAEQDSKPRPDLLLVWSAGEKETGTHAELQLHYLIRDSTNSSDSTGLEIVQRPVPNHVFPLVQIATSLDLRYVLYQGIHRTLP